MSTTIITVTGTITRLTTAGGTVINLTTGGSGVPQIQSDWNQADDTEKDYIKNKPSIPAAQIQSDLLQSDTEALDFIKNKEESFIIAISGFETDITADTEVAYFDMPYAFHVNSVSATMKVAPVGSNAIFDIKETGTTILSTLISIDNGEYSSATADTPPVISDDTLASGARITFDIVQIGSSTAGQEAVITIKGYRV